MENHMHLLNLTTSIVAAQSGTGAVRNEQIPDLIIAVFNTLSIVATPPAAPIEPVVEKPVPKVSRAKSLADPAHILSMIDGKPYKSLKRHIGGHGYTDVSYREAFGLPASYPMTAPDYSEARRTLAKKIGLGRKPGARQLYQKSAH